MTRQTKQEIQNETVKQIVAQQRLATDPYRSVWLEASAGSGKTKVLIDRLLNLILAGADIHHILTLTYTHAAAAEIRERIGYLVTSWLSLEDHDLIIQYLYTFGHQPKMSVRDLRRRMTYLEHHVQDLSIQTFHAFCISLLRQFPIEADLPPDFSLHDDLFDTSMLRAALEETLNVSSTAVDDADAARKESRDPEQLQKKEALIFLAHHIKEGSLRGTLEELIKKRFRFYNLDHATRHLETICEKQFNWQILPKDFTKDDLCSLCRHIDKFKEKDEEHCVERTGQDAMSCRETLFSLTLQILPWDVRFWDISNRVILTFHHKKKHAKQVSKACETINRQFSKKKSSKDKISYTDRLSGNPVFKELLYVCLVHAFIIVSRSLLARYHRLKQHRGIVDYEDLIQRTVSLLEDQDTAHPWVLEKYDNKINHILIDEAQDTAPHQWRIIVSLAQSALFSASGKMDPPPSLFVVGDFKQSIYSFQGADPSKFHGIHDNLVEKFREAGLTLQRISLDINFRSAPQILKFVDDLFSGSHKLGERMGVPNWRPHQSNNLTSVGHVTILDPLEVQEVESNSSKEEIGSHFVETLAHARQELQPQADTINLNCQRVVQFIKDNNIAPRDVMVLLPRRSKYQMPLARAFYRGNLPQAGGDRLRLGLDGAVLDVRMVMAATLDAFDDFALACVLRGPFVELEEKALFDLAHDRKASLYESLVTSPSHVSVVAWLRYLVHIHRSSSLHAFLQALFDSPCPSADQGKFPDLEVFARNGRTALLFRHGESSNDALNELLNQTMRHDQYGLSASSFLHTIDHLQGDMRRELETDHQHAAQVTTIHGAKGRESPVIILPDILWPTTRGLQQDFLLWNGDMPLPKFTQSLFPESLNVLKSHDREAHFQESLRLLYVALTRAKRHIIIFPETKANPPKYNESLSIERAWYHILYGMQQQEKVKDTKRRRAVHNIDTPKEIEKHQDYPRLHSRETLAFQAVQNEIKTLETKADLGTHKQFKAVLQSSPQIRRGALIHSLLAYVDAFSSETQLQNGLQGLLAQHEPGMSKKEKHALLKEVLSVVNHPQIKRFFPSLHPDLPKCQALVESDWFVKQERQTSVPKNLRPDRICLFGEALYFLDYKSHEEPTKPGKTLPHTIRQQMYRYHRLLCQSYPDKPVHGVIVWTKNRQINLLSHEILLSLAK